MAFGGVEYNQTYLQLLPYELQEIIEHEVQRHNFNDVLSSMMREINNHCASVYHMEDDSHKLTKYQVLLNDIMCIITRHGMHCDDTINFIHTHSVFREILFWIKMVYSLKYPIAIENVGILTLPDEVGEDDVGAAAAGAGGGGAAGAGGGNGVVGGHHWWRVPICSRGHEIENSIADLQRYRWPPWGPRRTISPYQYFDYIEKVLLTLEYMEILSLHKYLIRQYNSELVVMGVNMY